MTAPSPRSISALSDLPRASRELDLVLSRTLGPALKSRRPPPPPLALTDPMLSGRRSRARRGRGPALPFALGALVASAAAVTVWLGPGRGGDGGRAAVDPAARVARPAGGGGGLAGALERKAERLMQEAHRAHQRAVESQRRASEEWDREAELVQEAEDVQTQAAEERREASGVDSIERTITECGDDPLCPLMPEGPVSEAAPRPGAKVPGTPHRKAPVRPAQGAAPAPAPALDPGPALAPVRQRLQRCATQIGAHGVIMLHLQVAADGTVSRTLAPVGGAGFKTCVGNAMRRVRFPPPGRPVEVSYPLMVKPPRAP